MTELANVGEAKTLLHELFCVDTSTNTPVDELAGLVVKAFKGEPQPGTAPKPSALTIFTTGITSEDYQFQVRLYVDPSTDALTMQDQLDAGMEAVSALLDAEPRCGRSDWQCGYDASIDALVAQTSVEIGREDF